ncbi:circadian-associated transcriptional repressor-like [Carcharodon carcharias]|uniref:circadian-associated transcriptional repressor-like n=1 Tax=Carcharodon carcharias TaxID=13397 RepID=UPI001B7E851B|nr:circadian-associated transcriptional repressor-like [Carcharodon carcharias]
MDLTGSRASRESIEGFSSEEDRDCDVFLSDSDSDKHIKESGPCLDRPTGLPVRDQPTFTGMGSVFASEGSLSGPQAFIPHPMSASHLKKPLENIYFASASVSQRSPLPAGADPGRNWELPLRGHLVGQHSKRFISRGLKRRWEWEESRQHGTALSERMPHVKSRGDLLFAQKCKELQVFIRPLTVLLNGLKTGRYNRGLSSFQQSVAMDRIQRIVGVLQKPAMGERYLGTLLKVEMMLKVWFPHVPIETPNAEGSGPTGTECNARKHARTNSSGTSSSWESVSPPSSRRQSSSDGGTQERVDTAAAGGQEEGPEPAGGAPEGSPGGTRRLYRVDGTSAVRCLALVMQDSSVSSTTRPWRPARSSSAPPCLPTGPGEQAPTWEARSPPVPWPRLLACEAIVLLDLRERPGGFGGEGEGEGPSK